MLPVESVKTVITDYEILGHWADEKPCEYLLQRARDLFFGLWIPDLFMERVENDGEWSLMCPDECPGLQDAVGEEFKELYTQ